MNIQNTLNCVKRIIFFFYCRIEMTSPYDRAYIQFFFRSLQNDCMRKITIAIYNPVSTLRQPPLNNYLFSIFFIKLTNQGNEVQNVFGFHLFLPQIELIKSIPMKLILKKIVNGNVAQYNRILCSIVFVILVFL